MSNGEPREETRTANDQITDLETKAILAVIVFGILFPVAAQVFSLPVSPIVISLLLGLAIGAFIHRLLGGIGEQIFTLGGVVKLGGVLAAVMAVTWFVNDRLVKQTKPAVDLLLKPHHNEWLAVNRDSLQPISLEVPFLGETISPPEISELSDRLTLTKENGYFLVRARNHNGFPIGRLERNTLCREFEVQIESQLIDLVITNKRTARSPAETLEPLPFSLSTGAYDREYSPYRIVDQDGEELASGSIYQKGGKLHRINGQWYVILVASVNHKVEEPWAIFAVGQVDARVVPAFPA